MTTVFPRRNLGPDAEPWGRTIQGAVSGLERDLEQAINSNNATDQMQTTQLNSLVRSQQELANQQVTLETQQDQLRNGVDVDGWAYDAPVNATSDYFELTRALTVPTWATSLYVTAYATVEGTISSGTSGSVGGELYVDLARTSDPQSTFLQVSASGIQLPGQLYFIGGHNQRIAKIDLVGMTTLFINISAFVSPIPASGKAVGFYSGVTAFWRAD